MHKNSDGHRQPNNPLSYSFPNRELDLPHAPSPPRSASRARDTLSKPSLTHMCWRGHGWSSAKLNAATVDFEIKILLGAKGTTETRMTCCLKFNQGLAQKVIHGIAERGAKEKSAVTMKAFAVFLNTY